MFIDTHAHLEMEQFDSDKEEVIKRAHDAGVTQIISVATHLGDCERTIRLAQKYESIHATVGVHPHDAEKTEDAHFAKLKKMAEAPEVIAVGETGLDYFKNYSPKEVQLNIFKKHIRLARDIKKPLIIHCRDAWDDLFPVLAEEKGAEIGGIIHCFSGDRDIALKCVDLGFYVSFAGPVTYPKATKLRDAAKAVPSHHLFAETDCPYLTPQSRRGKRNEPAFVVEVLQKLAEIKRVSLEDLGRIVLKNMANLFGIGDAKDSENIVYKIRNSLYINVTSRCTNHCDFCGREENPIVAGYDLKLKKDPSPEEAINRIGDPTLFDEIVFCGYGEPTLRLDFIKVVSAWIKERGGRVRVNTNGHANLIHKRDVIPELKGLVDVLSVSLDAENEEEYLLLCKPVFGAGSYEALKEFIREAGKVIPEVVATVVRVPGRVDVEACEDIARNELGVQFKIREYNVVG